MASSQLTIITYIKILIPDLHLYWKALQTVRYKNKKKSKKERDV